MRLRTVILGYLGLAVVIYLTELVASWLGWDGNVASLFVLMAVAAVVLHKWIGFRTLGTWIREICSRAFWKDLD